MNPFFFRGLAKINRTVGAQIEPIFERSQFQKYARIVVLCKRFFETEIVQKWAQDGMLSVRFIFARPLRSLLVIALFFLSSCGFHLRGWAEIPNWLDNIAIIVEQGSRELEPLLTAQLKTYHVKIAASKAMARYWLVIENDSLQKQITNVSASTTPRQYLLLYTVQFSLIKNKGETLLSNNKVTVTRQFTLNNNLILGSDYEEMTFKREMEREAMNLLLSRLGSAQQITNNAH